MPFKIIEQKCRKQNGNWEFVFETQLCMFESICYFMALSKKKNALDFAHPLNGGKKTKM